MNYADTFLRNSNWSFENYITEEPEKNLLLIEQLVETDFDGINVLEISSIPGNGGTHFLSGLLKKLRQKDKNICSFSAENMHLFYKRGKVKELEKAIMEANYLVLDDLGYCNFFTGMNPWLNDVLTKFISKGGKLIYTDTSESIGLETQFRLLFEPKGRIKIKSKRPKELQH